MSEQRPAVPAEPASPPATVAAWDLPTRLFHWLLVVLIVLSWVSRKWGDAGLVWHNWNGYAILVLIVWRLIWGFTGSSTARFRSFFYWPWTVARYGIDFVLRRPRYFLGHNPLGGSVVYVMLGLIALQGGLGLFAYDDQDSHAGGPLAAKVSDATWAAAAKWHVFMFDVILALVALHLVANLLYVVWKGENLVKPMITGRKEARAYEDQSQATIAGVGHAVLALIAAILLVFGGIMSLGGKVF